MLKPLRVLVADDESLITLSLAAQLEGLGHEVVGAAQNGSEAVEMAEQKEPDLIILDIKMPELDGLETAKVINQRRVTPIIFLTGYSNKDIARRAGESGAFAYLSKPADQRDLVPAIEIAMSRHREMAMLKDEISHLEGNIRARKVIERAKGILMNRFQLTEAEAMMRMQKLCRDQNIKLIRLAKSIIFSEKLQTSPSAMGVLSR